MYPDMKSSKRFFTEDMIFERKEKILKRENSLIMALFQGPNIADKNKIRPKQLAKLMDSASKDTIMIIDVRDPNTDYPGGNIMNAVNIPYATFIKSVNEYAAKYMDKSTIIFHCMYSKVRGPKACDQYLKYIDKDGKDNAKLQKQKVFLLIGGFRKWMDLYCGINDKLIENLEPKYWKQDKYSKRWTHKNDW